ncbi:MAG: aminopeptidase [Flexilinea sp.]
MINYRWDELADVLLNYSLEVKKSENVMLAMKELEAFPLITALYEKAIQAGANVQVQMLSEEFSRSLLKFGSLEQIQKEPGIESFGMDWADVYIAVRSVKNLSQLSDIDPGKVVELRKTMGKISAKRTANTRWCLIPVPTPEMAVEAKMPFSNLMTTFFDACLLDWKKEGAEWQRISNLLQGIKKIHITGLETDLSFSIEGMVWKVDAGGCNMPGGEIYTAPNVDSVNGKIYFENPGVLGGRLVKDIRLEWKDGRIVNASASENEDFLLETIRMDEGAEKIGEFAFGTNPAITQWCNDILLDEKIGGTIHIALGRAYAENNGTNKSALHWDIIKDTRTNSEIYADDVLIFKNGKFVI